MTRSDKSRRGSKARRALEFGAVLRAVKKNKARFIARLSARVEPVGQCMLYRANKTPDGYPNITFKFKGHHLKIKAHRVFMILKHCAPLPVGYDVGHEELCKNRDCVKHISLQTVAENAAQANRNRSQNV